MARAAGQRLRGILTPSQRTLDALVAVAATGAALWVMAASPEIGAADPDRRGAVLLVAAGACLLLRRRFPAAILLAVTGLTTAYLVLDYSGGAELPLLLVALYTCVAQGRRWIGAGVTLYVVGSSAVYRLLVEGDDPLIVVVTISVVVLVATLGEVVHAHRRLRAEVAERVRLARAEQALEADAARATERVELARELHDVLAHTITAVTVQAGAAADGLARDTDAHVALRSMRATAREAMRQLEATIAVLRGDQPSPRPSQPQPSLRDLESLAAGARDAGLAIDLDVPAVLPALTSATALTAYRVVQEALTNVLRHADAEHVLVRVAEEDGHLAVEVIDDGVGARHGVGSGFGITGMRERTQALGGTLAAGPRDAGGFAVVARLPLEEAGAR